MTLDVHTLLWSSAGQHVVFAVLFFLLWTRARHAWFYLCWSLAEALYGLVAATLFIKPDLGALSDSMLLSALAAGGSAAIWVGLRWFDGKSIPANLREMAALLAGVALWGGVVARYAPALAPLPQYLTESAVCLLAAIDLARGRVLDPAPGRGAAPVAFGVFGTALLLALVGGMLLQSPDGQGGFSGGLSGRLPLAVDQWAGSLVFVALLAMANARSEARLEREALLDPQTGLLNRRGLEAAFPRVVGLAHRAGSPVALLLADLDHFKSVNDRYGHKNGDRALLLFVGAARRVLRRQSDFAARFGGEEFVILLPDTDLEGAALLAERLREMVAATPVAMGETSFQVTVSIGITTLAPDENGMLAALARADEALYAAKSRGRNQCVVVEPRASEREELEAWAGGK